jgi:hypothetical protein
MAVIMGVLPFTLPYHQFRSPSVAATGKPTAGRESPIPLVGGIERLPLPTGVVGLRISRTEIAPGPHDVRPQDPSAEATTEPVAWREPTHHPE